MIQVIDCSLITGLVKVLYIVIALLSVLGSNKSTYIITKTSTNARLIMEDVHKYVITLLDPITVPVQMVMSKPVIIPLVLVSIYMGKYIAVALTIVIFTFRYW